MSRTIELLYLGLSLSRFVDLVVASVYYLCVRVRRLSYKLVRITDLVRYAMLSEWTFFPHCDRLLGMNDLRRSQPKARVLLRCTTPK